MDEDALDAVKRLLKKTDFSRMRFTGHFYDRSASRPVSEGLVRQHLHKSHLFLHAEIQKAKLLNERKFRVWTRLSRRYFLVISLVFAQDRTYVITAWNTVKPWKKHTKE